MRKHDVMIYGTDLEKKPFRVPGGAICTFAMDLGDMILGEFVLTEVAAGWVRLLSRHTPVELFADEYEGVIVVKVQPRNAGRPVAGPMRAEDNATKIDPPPARWVAAGPEGVN